MMQGKLYIDGKDAYTAYGVYLSYGSFSELLTLPAFKEFAVNDWQEYDGEEVDLSDPVLPSRTITMTFRIADDTKLGEFINALSDQGYHSFVVASLGRAFKLRLVSMPSWSSRAHLGTFSLKLADDFPPVVVPSGLTAAKKTAWKKNFDPVVRFLEQSPGTKNLVSESGITIDGVDFSRFGIRILQGALDSLSRVPDVKPALSRSSKYVPGEVYDSAAPVRYQARDIQLQLLLRTKTIADFWTQWEAMLTLLLKPGERTLSYNGKEQQAHYKGVRVTNFDPIYGNGPWCEFQLTLRIIDPKP